MEIFKKYLSSPEETRDSSAIDTIEKLIERLNTSVRLDDRRDAMRGIKAMSREYRVEVGSQAIFICSDILKNHSDDTQSVALAIDTLYNVMCDDAAIERANVHKRLVNIPADLGGMFTEMFAKEPENIKNLFAHYDSFDFHLRLSVIKLVTLMISNMPRDMPKNIFSCPNAISQIVESLNTSHDAFCSEVLLLLNQLTAYNENIQKIVAFENGFGMLLHIIETHEYSDGGVLVEDCIKVIHNLLQGNSGNQIFFKEHGIIKQLNKFFEFQTVKCWTPQKLVNVCGMLKVLRCLSSPANKQQAKFICQTEMRDCGLLNRTASLIVSVDVPQEVLNESVYTCGEMVRGCIPSQQLLAMFAMPTTPPVPLIKVLLLTMFGSHQPFSMRISALYCFQCLIFNNPDGQANIISTLRPSKNTNTNELQVGPMFCSGLYSKEADSAWFAAIAMAHSINQNVHLKEELLKVRLASDVSAKEQVFLLQQCFDLLGNQNKIQARMGILQLLIQWLWDCPLAVEKFLANPKTSPSDNMSKLIAESASVDVDDIGEEIVRGLLALLIGVCVCQLSDEDRKERLLETIEKRVGLDVLLERINRIPRSDTFFRSMKSTQPIATHANELFFDYQFTILFRTIEYKCCEAFSRKGTKENELSSLKSQLQVTLTELQRANEKLNDALLMSQVIDEKRLKYKRQLQLLKQEVSDEEDSPDSSPEDTHSQVKSDNKLTAAAVTRSSSSSPMKYLPPPPPPPAQFDPSIYGHIPHPQHQFGNNSQVFSTNASVDPNRPNFMHNPVNSHQVPHSDELVSHNKVSTNTNTHTYPHDVPHSI